MEHHVKPLGDRVLIAPLEEPEVIPTGILIPETARKRPAEGVVVELGTGRTDKEGRKLPFEIKPGDRVLLSTYCGTEVLLKDKTFKVVQCDDVLALSLSVELEPQLDAWRRTVQNYPATNVEDAGTNWLG